MRFRFLRKLTLNRVDVVPIGANPGAHIEMFKQKKDGPSDETPTIAHKQPDQPSEVEMDEVQKSAEELQKELETVQAAEKKAQDELAKAKEELDKTPAAEVEKLKKELAEKDEALKEAKGEPDVQKQLADAEARLEKVEKERRAEQFVAKAKSQFANLGSADRIGRILEAADTHFEQTEKELLDKILSGANEGVEKGKLFAQLADGTEPEGAPTFEERIRKAAAERVEKSEGKLTIEQAMAQIMQEDRELQKEYVKSVRS